MKIQTLTLVAALAFITIAAAAPTAPTTKTDGTYSPTSEVGHCIEYQVKMLYAATDPQSPLQQGYLTAAEAFRQLELAGQTC